MLQDHIIGVSACRLADGRLHFGHYNGCFHSAKMAAVAKNYFVIQNAQDTWPPARGSTSSSLLALLSQLYGLECEAKIIACVEWDLFPTYSRLYDFAAALTTVRKLETTNPKKDSLRVPEALSVRDYLFPLGQAVQFLAFGPNFILTNDDNLRFVNLARNLHKKLTTRFSIYQFPSPVLLTNPVPRLISYDGRKMSKGNKNCIYLLGDEAQLREQVRCYARSLGWGLGKDGRLCCVNTQSLGDHLAVETPLINAYASLVLGKPMSEHEVPYVRDVPDLIQALESRVLDISRGVCERVRENMQRPNYLLERLAADTELAKERVEQIVHAFDGDLFR